MAVIEQAHADNLNDGPGVGTVAPNKRAFPTSLLSRILHEPLAQFLFFGAVLFLFFYWRGGGSGGASNRIVITHAQIEQLAVGFERTWQRPPNPEELKGLIDEYVKEEIATREAVAMGLDRNDVIIRRRLRQKLEFIAAGNLETSAPTDAELQAWMNTHPDAFRSDPEVAFRQVYLSPQRHGASIKVDAAKILARLKEAGPDASTANLGDVTMLPAEQPLATLFDAERTFGEGFIRELMTVEPGQWTGPLESPFGMHLVLVSKKVAATQQPLSAVRQQAERAFVMEREKREIQNLYDRLLEKYTVKVDPLPAANSGAAK
jgi:hypothetical protein